MWKQHSDIYKSDLHVPWTNNIVTSGSMNIHSIIIPTFNISLAMGAQGSFIREPGRGPLCTSPLLFFLPSWTLLRRTQNSLPAAVADGKKLDSQEKKIGITILSWKKTTSALELEIGNNGNVLAKAVKKTTAKHLLLGRMTWSVCARYWSLPEAQIFQRCPINSTTWCLIKMCALEADI